MVLEIQSHEVITADKAIDESNVGNRMLRNMGWQEGLGLGKDGSGMVEPVQAQAMEKRSGTGESAKEVGSKLGGASWRQLLNSHSEEGHCQVQRDVRGLRR
ncbi:hypothetical protein ACSBR2_037569 [Camellia fascicularis]